MPAVQKIASNSVVRMTGKAMGSKVGMFLGLVILVIATCPGARGEGLSGLDSQPLAIVGESFALAPEVDAEWLHSTAAASPTRDIASKMRSGAPARSDKQVASASKTELAAAQQDLFPHSSHALPMLVGPALSLDASSASLRPMVGAAVGVRTWAPRTSR